MLAAIREFDRVGREAFRRVHGFGPARRYVLVYDGESYDSKAIAGVAHGYMPGERPLLSTRVTDLRRVRPKA
jgi:5-methylcytosine-specific restriction enzyme A